MSNHATQQPMGPPAGCVPPQVPERFRELGHQFNEAMVGLRSAHGQFPRPPAPLPLGPEGLPDEGAGVSRQGKKGGPAATKRSLEDFDASLRGMPLVLRYLSEQGGSAYPSQIKKATGLTQARISNALLALENRGLVERSAGGKDRRHVVVTITQAGKDAVAERMAAMDAYAGSLLEQLGEQDSKELIRIVHKLATVLEAAGSRCRETRDSGDGETASAKDADAACEDKEGQ